MAGGRSRDGRRSGKASRVDFRHSTNSHADGDLGATSPGESDLWTATDELRGLLLTTRRIPSQTQTVRTKVVFR
jgi:hypothetical protein